ncbi:MAG: methyltransferase domain-containing protein [Pseudomonadota bacterium]
MRTDILDLHRFYERPLGQMAASFIAARIVAQWGDGRGMRVAGFGFTSPYLEAMPGAERRLNLAPAAQGVIRWPTVNGGAAPAANSASLISEMRWPLPDASIDRLILAHGLEEVGDPARLMREIWRVLSPDGRVIIVAAHRRGLWSAFDTTPFAAGRPWSRRQLWRLLEEATFTVVRSTGALYFPPLHSNIILSAARSWERAGARVWPALGGVLLVEATKELMAPVGKLATDGVRIQRRAAVRPASSGAAAGMIDVQCRSDSVAIEAGPPERYSPRGAPGTFSAPCR